MVLKTVLSLSVSIWIQHLVLSPRRTFHVKRSTIILVDSWVHLCIAQSALRLWKYVELYCRASHLIALQSSFDVEPRHGNQPRLDASLCTSSAPWNPYPSPRLRYNSIYEVLCNFRTNPSPYNTFLKI